MITISFLDASGALLASSAHESEAFLCVNRAYEPGDTIVIDSDIKHVWAQLDTALLPG